MALLGIVRKNEDGISVPGEGENLEERRGLKADIEEILAYFGKMSPDVEPWQKWLTKNTIRTASWLTKEAMGWEVVQRLQGKEGTEGVLGNYRLEAELVEQPSQIQQEKRLPRKYDRGIKRFFLQAVEVAHRDYLHCKYLPSDGIEKYFDKHRTYPRRESDNPVVRLVLPERKGYLDVKYSMLGEMLSDRYVDNNEKMGSELEDLIVAGEVDKRKMTYGYPIHQMEEWNDPGRDGEEPPWLVLSVTREGQKPLRVRDPRILAHAGLVIGEKGVPVKANFDFAHVPIWGKGADWYMTEVLDESFVENGVTMERGSGEVWGEPERLYVNQHCEGEGFGEVVGGEAEEVFGGDQLLLGLAKKLDVFQIDVTLDVGRGMGKYLREHSKRFGGMVGLRNLGMLLSEGQAPFFMIEHEGERGLQIGLGLGGARLLRRLRVATGHLGVRDKYEEWSDADRESLYVTLAYWKREMWREEYIEEVERGKERGMASVSALAAMVGEAQKVVQDLAGKVTSSWANFTRSRWQESSLGAVSKRLNKKVKRVVFKTAGSRETGVVVGEKGEVVTGQFFAKDPVVWGETLVKILETLSSETVGEEMVEAWQRVLAGKLREGGEYQELSELMVWQVGGWLERIGGGKRVEEEEFGEAEIGGERVKSDVKTYLRTKGETAQMREEVIASCRVMAAVLNELMDSNKSCWWWRRLVKQGLMLTANEQMMELVLNTAKLAVIDEMAERLPSIGRPWLGEEGAVTMRQEVSVEQVVGRLREEGWGVRAKRSELPQEDDWQDVLAIDDRLGWLKRYQDLIDEKRAAMGREWEKMIEVR